MHDPNGVGHKIGEQVALWGGTGLCSFCTREEMSIGMRWQARTWSKMFAKHTYE